VTLCGGWVRLGILAVGLILPVLCQAAVKGTCSTCHTMHNSQEGAPVAYTFNPLGGVDLTEVPFANLLKTDCLGCHSSAGAETIINLDDSVVPIVFNLTEPTYPPTGSPTSTLAAGNFHWVVNNGDAYGHNVNGISVEDFRFPPTQAPGGVARTGECANCHGTLANAQSGCEGCHVVQHHASGSADLVAGQDQGWYRFLGSVMQRTGEHVPTEEGVVGIEAPDWEQNPLANQHNSYQGKAGPYVSYLESGAIDQKCVGCHGQFHNETTANSTWIRHPVDVAIPDSGEFTSLTTYDPLVPVARQNVSPEDAGFSVVNRGSDMVSCITCHRPHGSPYPAMLRWGYRDWPGNDSHTQQPALNGCAVCHTSKD
jgi:Doubled CXXCH motif (Paired_CXXCH_1)